LRTEVVEQLEWRRAGEPGCVAADQHVVEEHADDRGVVGLAVSGIGWEQKLLLEAEVQLLLGVPVAEECPGRLRGGLDGRAAQALGDHECVVVIAREGDEGGMALHDAVGPAARSASASTRIASRPPTAAVTAAAGAPSGASPGARASASAATPAPAVTVSVRSRSGPGWGMGSVKFLMRARIASRCRSEPATVSPIQPASSSTASAARGGPVKGPSAPVSSAATSARSSPAGRNAWARASRRAGRPSG